MSASSTLLRALRVAASKAREDRENARASALSAERAYLAAIVEELIARIDEIDGDPDFEPETDRGVSEDEPAFAAAIRNFTDGARWPRPVFKVSGLPWGRPESAAVQS